MLKEIWWFSSPKDWKRSFSSFFFFSSENLRTENLFFYRAAAVEHLYNLIFYENFK